MRIWVYLRYLMKKPSCSWAKTCGYLEQALTQRGGEVVHRSGMVVADNNHLVAMMSFYPSGSVVEGDIGVVALQKWWPSRHTLAPWMDQTLGFSRSESSRHVG